MLNKRIGLDFMAVTRAVNEMSKGSYWKLNWRRNSDGIDETKNFQIICLE